MASLVKFSEHPNLVPKADGFVLSKWIASGSIKHALKLTTDVWVLIGTAFSDVSALNNSLLCID